MSQRSTLADAAAAYHRGDLASAELLARSVLTSEEAPALAMLGMVLARRGKLADAVEHLRKATASDPSFVPAHIALSQVYERLGRSEDALQNACYAVQIEPNDPETVSFYAAVLSSNGRLQEAAEVLASLAQSNPNDPRVWDNLARAQKSTGDEIGARSSWERAAGLPGAGLSIYLQLGQLCLAHGDFEHASHWANLAVRRDPSSAAAQTLLALALAESGLGSEAESHLRRALKLNPADAIARASLGFWLQEQGRFDEAASMLDKAVALNPSHGFAQYNIVRARSADDRDVRRIRNALEAQDLAPRDAQYLHYALGKSLEDIGNFEEAISAYDQANRLAYEIWLARSPWRKADYEASFNEAISTYDGAWGAPGSDSEKPVFIVGMIRSGTTLVEQILSSHPEVAGAGELAFWHEHEHDKSTATHLAEEYLRVLDCEGADYTRVTDKLPHNYAMLGLIHQTFPKARIVHVRRNALDNCLSVYTTAYQRPPVFAHDKQNIVFAYRQYEKIMRHWREVIPRDRLMDIDYEEIVRDRGASARRLVEFAGLAWSEDCLHHERNTRAVRTPSLWQVRQPVYTSSVERWRRFEPWLGELSDLRQSCYNTQR